MTRLEDIVVGSSVAGLAVNETVNVIAVKWFGNAVLEVTYKDSKGNLANQMVMREDESHLEVLESHLP